MTAGRVVWLFGGVAALLAGGAAFRRSTDGPPRARAPGAEETIVTASPRPTRALAAVQTANAPGGSEAARREAMADLVFEPGGVSAAQQMVKDAPTGEPREELLRAFEFAWAGVDPDAALAWAAKLPDRDERAEALARVLVTQGSSEPLRAIENTRRLDADHGADLTDELVQRWAATDFTAARNWCVAQPAGTGRDRTLARVAFVQARSFPDEAAWFALMNIPPGPALDEAVVSIVHQWTLRDPTGARSWVETVPRR